MNQLSLLLLVDSDPKGLETLKYGFEREGCAVAGTSDHTLAPELARTTTPQLAIISLRAPERSGLDLIASLRGGSDTKDLPVVTLGPAGLRQAAMAAGASDFLTTPLFFRDVLSVGRLMLLIQEAAAGNKGELELQSRLSEYYSLYYLLRAIAGTGRSGILQLNRGNKKGEIRFCDGAVTSAQVGSLQGFPALHQLLLWEEAALSLKLREVLRRGQFSLSPAELLDECERFLRDFAHASRDLGPPGAIYLRSTESPAHWAGLVPSDVGPLLRLFDGRLTLGEVIEESPFRVFDTLRVLKRLLDSGGILPKPAAVIVPKTVSRGGGAQAPVRPARPTPIHGSRAPDQRGGSGDRRKSNRHRPLGPGPAGRGTPAPIPLTVKKASTAPTAAGQIHARKQHRTPAPVPVQPVLGDAATVQVRLDVVRRPNTPAPLVPHAAAPITAHQSARGSSEAAKRLPTPQPTKIEPRPKAKKAPDHSLTPTSAFDAIEADFFAREADLYTKEVVESFDDLERDPDPKLRRPSARPVPRNARKKR